MNTFKAIRKVHEVTNHKSAEQLLKQYRRANLIGPNTVKLIKQVVRDCKICQKFGRSMVKPKIALPNASSFNEVVTLDLKQFGDKYVLVHRLIYKVYTGKTFEEQESRDSAKCY